MHNNASWLTIDQSLVVVALVSHDLADAVLDRPNCWTPQHSETRRDYFQYATTCIFKGCKTMPDSEASKGQQWHLRGL